MISIRKGQFETNSSSCHKLIVPAEQQFIVPKILNFNSDASGIEFLQDYLEKNDHLADYWISFLYANGVEEIKYFGDNTKIESAIEKYKGCTEAKGKPCLPSVACEVLPTYVYLSAIFGENIYLYYAYDYEDEPEELDGKHFVFIWY